MVRRREAPSRTMRPPVASAAILRDVGLRLLFRIRVAYAAAVPQRRFPMAPTPVIRLHPDDGVLIARSSLPAGMVVTEGVITAERIPAGHKVAIKPIATGEPIRRYGQIIGFATQPIASGQHVHTQNCGMGDFDKDYAY